MIAERFGIGRLLFGAVDMLGVNIAQGGHVDAGILLEAAHHVGAAVTRANHSKLNRVVGAEDSGVGGGGHSGCTAAQEIAPRNLVGIHVRIIALNRTNPVCIDFWQLLRSWLVPPELLATSLPSR